LSQVGITSTSEDITVAYTIGIDIGGTFTDAFAISESGEVHSAKASSTPPDFDRGVIDSVTELAGEMGKQIDELLAEVSYICHGTTSTLNALVTGKVAKVGFLTTEGHRDSVYIMNVEGRYAGLGVEEIQDVVNTHKPAPLVSKRLARGVVERVDYKGEVIVALDEAAARKTIKELIELGVEGIAISLLWSFINPTHERRLREIVHELAPDLYVALSSDVSPRIREYARNSTTIMSTQVGPPLKGYLEPLEGSLRSMGFDGALLIMQGSGGSIAADIAPRHAITTVGSVLTGGVSGCRTLGAELGHANVISTDMGGTTFLVGMVVDGSPVSSPSTTLNQFTISVPQVQVNAIGGGGGAIAWIDDGGNLKVGPNGAGANPGPAAYGQGGTEPTITDADILLGIVNPDYFLGGRKTLDRSLSEEAVRTRIAEPLGLSVEEAAAAIYTIATAQAGDLIRRVVVNEGYDPRDFALYAFGGAAPAHCCAYARDIGAKEIVVPLGSTASTFSAYGLATSDVVLTAELSRPANFPVAAEAINEVYATLEADLTQRLSRQGVEFTHVSVERVADIRYTLQLAEVSTPVKGGVLDDRDVAQLGDDFEALYERLYGRGAGFRDAGLQLITYRVQATGHLPFRASLPAVSSRNGVEAEAKGTRRVLLDPEQGWQEASVFDYRDLRAGHQLSGPAIVEAPTTTVALTADAGATVDRFGNLSISIG
jgi:N-methylhydantoinase A